MAYAAYNYTITDAAGNIVTGASIEVRRESDNVLVPLYSDRDGTALLANPFTDSTGTGRFHAAGSAYKVTATLGGFTRTFRYVPIGLAGEIDLVVTPSEIRERLTANRTYYVRTDGSDSNNGLANTAGGAFLTIQKALDVASELDFNVHDVTIQVADGTYAPSSGFPVADVRSWAGSGSLFIVGNTGTPANVVFSATAANAVVVSRGALSGMLILNGLKLQTTTSGNCLSATVPAVVEHSNMDFSACAGNHINASFSAFISAKTNYTISGGAVRHWNASTFGRIDCSSKTVTLSGTPAFTTFAGVVMGYLAIGFNTFSGGGTGARYDASLNGVINTVGGGASYLPGNAAGSATTGGQYV